MKKLGIFAMAAVLLTGVLSSCGKYEDGGLISKADKRILGVWEMEEYQRNGVNETDQILISNYSEEYKEDGTFIRSYTNVDGEAISDTGNWALNDDQTQVEIMGVSSIEDFSNENSTLSTSKYDVLRLKKDEYWFSYENGGDLNEFRMMK